MQQEMMGNQRLSVIPARAVSDPELSDGAFRTLAALGMFGDRNGWCYPSYATLAQIRGLSKSAIAKHITELVERGYLNIHHRFDEVSGAQRSSLLQIRFDYEPDEPGAGVKKTTKESPPRFRGGNPPYTSEVNGGYTSEVNGGYTPEVNPPYTLKGERLTSHINAPINAPVNGGGGVNDPVDVAETGTPPPPPPPPPNPTDDLLNRAEKLYRMVRPSHLMIPRTRWYEDALQVLNQTLDKHNGDYERAAGELRRYAEEADRRNIAPTNLCWLTEWAAAGKVPPLRRGARGNGNGQKAVEERRDRVLQETRKRFGWGSDALVYSFDIERLEKLLELWPLLEARGATDEDTFRMLAWHVEVPVEEIKRRLEVGEGIDLDAEFGFGV